MPVKLVALLELGHGDTDLGEILEDTAMEDLFFPCPIEAFGNAIGPRLGNQGEARRDAPELDLVEEVVGGVCVPWFLCRYRHLA